MGGLHTSCKSKEQCPADGACGTVAAFRERKKKEQCTNKPKAIFIIGVPASGKDAVLKDLVSTYLGSEKAVVLDPDEIKTMLVKHGGDSLAQLVKTISEDTKATDKRKFVQDNYDISQILAQHIHRESIVLSYEAQMDTMAACKSFLVQKTGTRWTTVKEYAMDATARGYEVSIFAVHLHPFSNWANHLHRVKHFKSAGRAMDRNQVVNDNKYYPLAIKEMLQEYVKKLEDNEATAMADVKFVVYGNIQDVIKKAPGATHDVFAADKPMEELVKLWNPHEGKSDKELAAFYESQRKAYQDELGEEERPSMTGK